jgi:DNA-binding CsgD family transcriptional regulator
VSAQEAMDAGSSTIAIALRISDREVRRRVGPELSKCVGLTLVDREDDADVVITDGEAVEDRPCVMIRDVAANLEALTLGVSVLPRLADARLLRIAIEASHFGLICYPRNFSPVSSELSGGFDDEPEPRKTQYGELSRREMQVLELMALGASNKAIARQLGFSVHTAKFHVASILVKLEATSRADAVARAIRADLRML